MEFEKKIKKESLRDQELLRNECKIENKTEIRVCGLSVNQWRITESD